MCQSKRLLHSTRFIHSFQAVIDDSSTREARPEDSGGEGGDAHRHKVHLQTSTSERTSKHTHTHTRLQSHERFSLCCQSSSDFITLIRASVCQTWLPGPEWQTGAYTQQPVLRLPGNQ